MNFLDTSIEYLKGVGPQRAQLLQNEMQIFNYRDLLQFYPNRYLDRTKFYSVFELKNIVSEVQIIGKIIHLKSVEFGKNKTRLVATFADNTGQIELVWFQGIKWVKENIKINEPYVIFGKINVYGQTISMPHPEMELLADFKKNSTLGLQAVYPSTEKLSARNITNKVIIGFFNQLFSELKVPFTEVFPENFVSEMKLISKNDAILNIHFPKNQDLLLKAQFRLKFEELFFIQLHLIAKNQFQKTKIKGFAFTNVGEKFTQFYANHLPFELTNSQKKVIKEIRNDMGKPAQMNRLLQGDVGSGKTIVAFMSMLLALDNGFQACLMAPTEILAQQHFVGLSELANKINLKIAILTGSTKVKDRKLLHEELEVGTLHILIGTHALLEDKVQFKNLGLAIIDEQHRFGVEQRSKLWKKNTIPPHILVMTATPIPRTLAMSLYGDLDISIINELPPGRKPIQTVHQFDNNRLKIYDFMKTEIAKGRQIYIVYPLIQESEKLDFKDLMDGYDTVSRDFPLPNYAVSIVHGKMKPAEKDFEMQRFITGKTNILVATTVIEVGVNVPNASVMIIESAERFGLSQLHQLRGRVGRGADQSYCILLTSHKLSNESKTRMETMVKTNDGFEIAEVDLKLRGPGDLMGKQQSGIMQLQIADLIKDQQILQLARQYAIKTLQEDSNLSLEKNKNLNLVFAQIAKKKNIWNYIS